MNTQRITIGLDITKLDKAFFFMPKNALVFVCYIKPYQLPILKLAIATIKKIVPDFGDKLVFGYTEVK